MRRKYILIDVSFGREVIGVAADVLGIGVLVHTDVVDLHRGGEGKVVDVDVAEVPRHAQVHDEVLVERSISAGMSVRSRSVPWAPGAPGESQSRRGSRQPFQAASAAKRAGRPQSSQCTDARKLLNRFRLVMDSTYCVIEACLVLDTVNRVLVAS